MKREMEIVLIEDNEDDAQMMLCFLRRHFTNDIRLIQDGADAVNFLLFENDSKPKLILLDVVLPSVDGIELYKIIRAEPKERGLSVVMLISSDRSRDYLKSLDIKPDGYLKKPKGEALPCRLAD
ncbi:MAG TPA: response regulator [Chryseosolibacter sp.]|nr:response regulator [Chryseosolibacter sp.]